MENDNLTVGLCSHPPRKEGLVKRVKEILPQLRKDDHFQVYLNNYSPDILLELPKDPRLEVILAGTYINGNIVDVREQYPDLCSFGKLFSFSKYQGYYATIDDDIIYRSDYLDYMREGCAKYKNQYIITIHGGIFGNMRDGKLANTPARENRELIGYDRVRSNDMQVHTCGMGITIFHSDLRIDEPEIFGCMKESGDDESFAVYANKHDIPIIRLAGREGMALPDSSVHIINPLYANDICVNLASEKLRKWEHWHLPSAGMCSKAKMERENKMEVMSTVLKPQHKEIVHKIRSSEALAAIIVDKVIKKEPLSVVRVSDGEGIFIEHGKGKPLHAIISKDWQVRYGVDGLDLRQLGQNLLEMKPDCLCPSISGFYLEQFDVFKYYPRDYYYDWAFPQLFAATDRWMGIFEAAKQVLVLHHDSKKVCGNLAEKYKKASCCFLSCDLKSWRDHEDCKDAVKKSQAHLILISGGPSGKVLCYNMARDYNKICLDVGEWLTATHG